MMFLLCRTEPENSKRDWLSYLLLSMESPGFDAKPLKTMTGRNEFNEVFFTDVAVPENQIVLGRGKGRVCCQRHPKARTPDGRCCQRPKRCPDTEADCHSG
jgi:alkylation response protein AidB-like acyl-CoA dehydrogenase